MWDIRSMKRRKWRNVFRRGKMVGSPGAARSAEPGKHEE